LIVADTSAVVALIDADDRHHRAVRELFEERDPLYRECARFVIETGRPSVKILVGMILMQLELAGVVDPAQVPSPLSPGGADG